MSTTEITLNNGVHMPQLGFGLYLVSDTEAETAVRTALGTGYRSLDTATLYGNEEGVGRALRASGLPREEVFVTTKLWNDDHGYDRALAAFDRSLERLGTDQVDLYLIHWPVPARGAYPDTWRALARIYAEGRARAVGVSNFTTAHLTRVIEDSGLVPAVNQVELHPWLPQRELRRFHAEHGIATEAWSPLGRGHGLLQEPVVRNVAAKHLRTPAQVVLNWHMRLGNIAIPKSTNPARIAENLDIFTFELDDEDMAAIGTLDNGRRVGPDPDVYGD
ncbi:aldo/keto reductase [Sinosporangium siamense]|uniref:Oxidoreductase n=1 Tax=Sinosporangium siamense TaxID=1367973 RepID=A0A919RH32_9ACTN|nr:aldo/keto reductase [Sinosporangium siamense]GII93756.1 oxidoreductase [Sinosporangium siamense]